MANVVSNIVVDVDSIVKEQHKIALANANKKVKDLEVKNQLVVDGKSFAIKVEASKKTPKSNVKKYLEEYLRYFVGEEIAKQLKDSDIEEEKSTNDFILKLDDTPVSTADVDSVDDGNDTEKAVNKSKPKKRFSIFSGVGDAAKQLLNFARSIHITVNGEPKFPIGKMLFGTTHDVQDTKEKIKEQIDKELPENALDYKILNSESVYNKLMKTKTITGKDPICTPLRQSKYTFVAYVQKDDINYDMVSKEYIQKAFKDALGIKVSVYYISDYTESNFKNSNDKNLEKNKKKDVFFKKTKDELKKRYDEQKKKLESKTSTDPEEIEKLKEDILIEYRKFLNSKYKEYVDKNKDSDNFDADEESKKFKEKLSVELEKFTNMLDTGSEDISQVNAKDLYVVPLTSKSLYGKLRNSFDQLGGKSTGDSSK